MTRLTSLASKLLVTLLIGSGTFATCLQAQSDAITVSVPFPFTVGVQSIAPGTFQFSLVSSHMESSQFLLSIRDVKTGDIEMFAVLPEHQRTFKQHGYLIFRSSAGRSVLAEVHFPGSDTFSELIQQRPAGRIEAKRSSTDSSMSMIQR